MIKKAKTDINLKLVVTPEARCSWPKVWKAETPFPGQEPKFSTTLLFPKNTNMSKLKKAEENTIIEMWGSVAKKPQNYRSPIKDGDKEKDKVSYAGHWVINASAKQDRPPTIVDAAREEIIDQSEIYGGCYVQAQLCAYAYDKMGNAGVSFRLNMLRKTRDGERFGGTTRDPKEVFSDEIESSDDGSDNEDSYTSTDIVESDMGF